MGRTSSKRPGCGVPISRCAHRACSPKGLGAQTAQYLTENQVNLFADKEAFDGVHGIMAYNRTIQQQGKATHIRPMEEWIVSVGKHEGVIRGEDWVRIQRTIRLTDRCLGKAHIHNGQS